MLALDPRSVKALYWRGRAYVEEADYDEAIKDFQDVLSIEPENTEAAKFLKSTDQKNNEFLAKQKLVFSRLFK